jgi:glycosyltransferase involved in cell wall biosynthesis
MKAKIYYLLGNLGFLERTSGDRINEMNVIRALAVYFDVYYNNELVDVDQKVYGSPEKEVELPDKEYDFYFVRANKDIFLQLPRPKAWFIAPYDYDCYRDADVVVSITDAWQRRCENIEHDQWLQQLIRVEPKDIVTPKHVFTFSQVIVDTDTQYFPEVSSQLRDSYACDLLIGHFGRLVKSNYPFHLERALEIIGDKYSIKVVYAGKFKEVLPDGFINLGPQPPEHVHSLVKACDVITYNQDEQGEVAGALKVLEAIAASVPVLSPRYAARVEELGEEYPFYWQFSESSNRLVQAGYFDQKPESAAESNWSPRKFFRRLKLKKDVAVFEADSQSLAQAIVRAIESPSTLQQAAKQMDERKVYYGVHASAKRFKQAIDKVI